MSVLIFLLKCLAITLFVDTYLFWLHIAYHHPKSPKWLQNIHRTHHIQFQRDRKLHISLSEFMLEIPPGFLFALWITGSLPFALFVVLWGLFEASRGHGQYKIKGKHIPLLPKAYYKSLMFCGGRYHTYHHDYDENKNFGQMLKIWDKILGTEFKLEKQKPSHSF